MAFAEKLIAVRRAHHLTQEQLAAKLFVTRQAISRWERGEVTPGIDMMKLIDGFCVIVQEHRKLDTKKRIVLFLAT